MPTNENPEIMNVAETCRLLRVSRGKLYELVHTNVVPCIRLSPKVWRFSRARLIRWLDERQNQAA
jgi:excisionase family DNA binding protein